MRRLYHRFWLASRRRNLVRQMQHAIAQRNEAIHTIDYLQRQADALTREELDMQITARRPA